LNLNYWIVLLFIELVFGPSYGSPVKKMAILPVSKDVLLPLLGIQILPLDGNPHKSFAMICHSTGLSTLACSYDGRYAFTAGGQDCTVFSWELSLSSLEASAALEGKDMLALGFYPTEQEHEDMQNEVKFSPYAETRNYVMDIDLEEFIKLYVNHRPASGISRQELCNAFQVLGKPDEGGRYTIDRDELLELLQARGKYIFMSFISTLHVLTSYQCFNLSHVCLSHTESLLERALPKESSMETFATDFVGVSAATQELPQEHGHDL
uniref:WD repeat domain 66 n=1 Tax=Sinocyclocheilus grahami TaxID=75366 RepID=A0A672REM5_SINGR